MKTSEYRIILKSPKGAWLLNTLGQIVTSAAANGEMLFASEAQARDGINQLRQLHGDAIKDWELTVGVKCEAGEEKIEPGEYYGGSTLYKVTICDECGLPATKVIEELYFGRSDKGKARREKWEAGKKRLPYDLELCECGHNQEDEEED